MFWRHEKQPSEALRRELGAKLQERLRTALEFATLGAYDDAGEPARTAARREPQARVFLFAKVSQPCPHRPPAAVRCDAAGVDAREHGGVHGGGSLVSTRRRSRARRGGAVKVAPQPCTTPRDARS